jgi:4-hydroxybenzoate polyprenyltransferase
LRQLRRAQKDQADWGLPSLPEFGYNRSINLIRAAKHNPAAKACLLRGFSRSLRTDQHYEDDSVTGHKLHFLKLACCTVSAKAMVHRGHLLLQAMRPLDWIKNLFVFAALFFSGQANELYKLTSVLAVFAAFCAMSSAVYLFNDIIDRERDRVHPDKRGRPIAAGDLPVSTAAAAAVALMLGALALVSFSTSASIMLLLYGLMNVLYTLRLKNIVILDLFTIALGFVLRVYTGSVVIDVHPSSWLISATFLLSLVLGLGKRRHELVLMEGRAESHRPVLELYSVQLVDQLIALVAPVTLVTYLLYTLDPKTIAHFNSHGLYWTAAFVAFGIFRYLFLVHRRDLGSSPSLLLFQDAPLRWNVIAWVLAFWFIVYFEQ